MRQSGRLTGLGRLFSRPLTTSASQAPFRSAAAGIGCQERELLGLRRATLPCTRLSGVKSVGSERWYSSKKPVFEAGEAPSFAFAFDIDGVLLHVAKPIPGATESLQYLNDNNIPFILLTNGGGKPEAVRVKDLSDKLGVKLSVDNFVQSHTPFQELVQGPEGLGDKTIFLTGADAKKCREIAKLYGFKNVVTPADIIHAHPEVFPFELLKKSVYAETHEPLPKPIHDGTVADADALKIDAMFVFNDPRDWALDIQIITDLLLSRDGLLGTYSPKNGDASLPNGGWQQDGQPPLIFSNADLFWSTTYHQPRFGQGAFQAAVAGVWKEVTGGTAELRRTVFGKPFATTYQYAERVLEAHRRALLGKSGGGAAPPPPLKTVYMVGDNPESDIRGANDYSNEETEWASVLVKTGVWSQERGAPTHKPKMIVDDVKAAVEWALQREGRSTKI
ncbi:HAD-superfamily subfamily IIA hydrolase [Colletotrichum orchidophilum]|uniref:HAD-superfamily subfamily IIA hydrolase n=1 Tax=Colletotrichum orchidophilum TaxID=1209926 RepID=A0A1G4APS4_9PEZI|nr:HAD-superfamily subfamily IIA hydrolase [Colletotrichum orchidophilum]OHE91180.1 HAD-superfamily subfamily IIA hydrolase [Colletotrichum orchidophilum]